MFRTDVAQNLLEGFDAVSSQIDGLNDILRSAPEFSNGERYQFVHSPVEQHRALYSFLLQVKKHGEEGVDLFKEPRRFLRSSACWSRGMPTPRFSMRPVR
ncbi:hypothetical protein VM57_09485 [Stenotrophomonas maltophilia]|uniref:Uncharacterized protein n=1 Tax=Stenotrophomonas maltophilia TaxID=40324 RepID=A0A0F5ZNT7_STEMA|nr:hypothetical protein VM57_09485 [Stenotrophomonas maltophilia]